MANADQRSIVPYTGGITPYGSVAITPFCPAPTILEAINTYLRRRGMPLLTSHSDGTIGVTEPLLLQFKCSTNPFVN